jgi:hypothetical protein
MGYAVQSLKIGGSRSPADRFFASDVDSDHYQQKPKHLSIRIAEFIFSNS